jgi:hypothetical protein
LQQVTIQIWNNCNSGGGGGIAVMIGKTTAKMIVMTVKMIVDAAMTARIVVMTVDAAMTARIAATIADDIRQ